MENLIWLAVIATSIWVLIDAKRIGVKKGQIPASQSTNPRSGLTYASPG